MRSVCTPRRGASPPAVDRLFHLVAPLHQHVHHHLPVHASLSSTTSTFSFMHRSLVSREYRVRRHRRDVLLRRHEEARHRAVPQLASSHSLPPCSSTCRRARGRPRPVPRRCASTSSPPARTRRTPAPDRRGDADAAIGYREVHDAPLPSVTSRTSMRISLPASENFVAFDSRLYSTCLSTTRSADSSRFAGSHHADVVRARGTTPPPSSPPRRAPRPPRTSRSTGSNALRRFWPWPECR